VYRLVRVEPGKGQKAVRNPDLYQDAPYVYLTADDWDADSGCWFFFIAIIFIAILFIPLFFVPYYGTGYYYPTSYHAAKRQHAKLRDHPRSDRHPVMHDYIGRTADDCRVGEVFDPNLDLCLPKVNFPTALDHDLMNTQIPGCEDFYSMTCGSWIDDHQDTSRSFSSVFNHNQKIVGDIIRSPSSKAAHRLYASCVSTLVEGLHNKETKRELDLQMTTILGPVFKDADIPGLFGRLARAGFVSPLSLSIENHPRHPRMIPTFRHEEFELDERVDYEKVSTLFEKANDVATSRHKAREMFRILKTLGKASERNDTLSFFEYVSSPKGMAADVMEWKDFVSTFESNNPSFSMWEFMQTLGGSSLLFDETQEVWLLEKEYLLGFNTSKITIYDWKIYAEFSILHGVHDFFPDLENDVYFRTHTSINQRRYGHIPRRWRHSQEARDVSPVPTRGDCVHIAHKLLPGVVSHEWEKRSNLEPKDYRRVKGMVENIRSAYAQLVVESEWIDSYTKDEAIRKIQQINVRVGHPDNWPEEPFRGEISKDRYARNVALIRRYRVERDLGQWRNQGAWFDLDVIAKFGAPLSTVNAFYSPMTNSIVVFSGIMQPPFYHSRYDEHSMYSTLGVVVGHELSHSMDPTGSKFDRFGSYRKWWSKESRKELKERLQCIANEYQAPTACGPLPNYGNKTLGEDTADLIGVEIALKAWKKWVSLDPQNRTPEIGMVDATRHWFMMYSQIWCANYGPEATCARVKGDVHPVPKMRVTETLRNLPQFWESFGCSVPSRMVHKPECRVFGHPRAT